MAALEQVREALRTVATPERAKANAWFFKTNPGDYGYGDQFLGVTVPQQRKVAKHFYKTLSLDATTDLLKSPWHEERLTALFMLVLTYQKGDASRQDQVANVYLANTKYVNNWDLVDSSASYILGPWLDNNPYKVKTLARLANSSVLWERRIAMLTTLYYIAMGRSEEAFEVTGILGNDTHDLIQKAVGWMLREIGKRCSEKELTDYLDEHAAFMPRTQLRYAIERLTPEQRKYYMQLKQQ